MDVKNTAVIHEKVGENDHYYYVAPNASLDEVEFVVTRILEYVKSRKAEEQLAKNPPVPAPVEEVKSDEPKVE